jgi:hypothetical protein
MASNANAALDELMSVRGAVGVSLVDFTSGMSLITAGGNGLNLDLAAAGNSEVVLSKLRVMDSLGLKSKIEDILITLTDQYHLIRLLPEHKGVFLYYVLKRDEANLAIARLKLAEAESKITF